MTRPGRCEGTVVQGQERARALPWALRYQCWNLRWVVESPSASVSPLLPEELLCSAVGVSYFDAQSQAGLHKGPRNPGRLVVCSWWPRASVCCGDSHYLGPHLGSPRLPDHLGSALTLALDRASSGWWLEASFWSVSMAALPIPSDSWHSCHS